MKIQSEMRDGNKIILLDSNKKVEINTLYSKKSTLKNLKLN